jgi:hypothetical protein
MEDVGVFYGHLVHFTVLYFMDIWYSLWQFWYIFYFFGILYQENLAVPTLKAHRGAFLSKCDRRFGSRKLDPSECSVP